MITIPYKYNGNLSNINLSATIKSSLRYNGIVILENFFDTKNIDIINDLVNKDLADDNHVIKNKKSIFRIYTKKDLNTREELNNLAEYTLFKEISSWFYKTIKLNYDAMAHIDYPGVIANSNFHSDPTVGIKFYIHLNDINSDQGAMRYCLGSHLEGYLRLKHEINSGSLTDTFGYKSNNSSDMGYRKIIDVSSSKGSLIIFNTAGLHSAGFNKTNDCRRILRYQYSPKITKRTKLTRILRNKKQLPIFIRKFFARLDTKRCYCSNDALPIYDDL